MAFKLKFLREKKDAAQERKVQSEDRSRLPLEKAAELSISMLIVRGLACSFFRAA
jgi:hypothetical protein